MLGQCVMLFVNNVRFHIICSNFSSRLQDVAQAYSGRTLERGLVRKSCLQHHVLPFIHTRSGKSKLVASQRHQFDVHHRYEYHFSIRIYTCTQYNNMYMRKAVAASTKVGNKSASLDFRRSFVFEVWSLADKDVVLSNMTQYSIHVNNRCQQEAIL